MLTALLLIAVVLSMSAAMASVAYKHKSVVYKSTTITGIQNVEENDTVEDITRHRADVSLTTEAVFIDGVGCQIVVTTTDLGVRATWALGAVGSLVVVAQQRANGSGATGGADKTKTYANAVLVAIRSGAPYSGRGTLELTFEATDPAGAAVVVHT
jgi:hypothetical protein